MFFFTKLNRLFTQAILLLTLPVLKLLVMLGVSESDLGVLGQIVDSLVAPLKRKIESLNERISELEKVVECQNAEKSELSPQLSPEKRYAEYISYPSFDTAVGQSHSDKGSLESELNIHERDLQDFVRKYSDRSRSSSERTNHSRDLSPGRPRKRLPSPRRGSDSTTEPGEIKVIDCSSISHTGSDKISENSLVIQNPTSTTVPLVVVHGEQQEGDKESFRSISPFLDMDSRKPELIGVSHSHRPRQLPVIKTTPSPNPPNVYLSDLFGRTPDPHSSEPTMYLDVRINDDDQSSDCLSIESGSIVPTPVPESSVKYSDFIDLFEQEPIHDTDNLTFVKENLSEVSYKGDEDIVIKVETPLKSARAPLFSRQKTLHEPQEHFVELQHDLLPNTAAMSKRDIFQQSKRARAKSNEERSRSPRHASDSIYNSLTESSTSLEKVTNIEFMSPSTTSPMTSFMQMSIDETVHLKQVHFRSEDDCISESEYDPVPESEYIIDPNEDIIITPIVVDNTAYLSDDNEVELGEVGFTHQDSLKLYKRRSPPYQNKGDISPHLPQLVPSPISPDPPEQPPSPEPLPMSPEPDTDITAEDGDHEDVLNPPVKRSQSDIQPSKRKRPRKFSVQNIISKLENSSDVENTRRDKSSPSPKEFIKKFSFRKSSKRPESCPPLPTSLSNDSLKSSASKDKIFNDIPAGGNPDHVIKSTSPFDHPKHKPPPGLVKRMKNKLSRSQSYMKDTKPISKSNNDLVDIKSPKSKRLFFQKFINRVMSPKPANVKSEHEILVETDDFDNQIPTKPIKNTDYSPIADAAEVFENFESEDGTNWANFDDAFNSSTASNSPEKLQEALKEAGSAGSVTSTGKPPLPPSPSSRKRRPSLTNKFTEARVPRYAPCVMPSPKSELRRLQKSNMQRSPSFEQIVSKFENKEFERAAPQLANEISNNHALQKAFLDIIHEEGYALIKKREESLERISKTKQMPVVKPASIRRLLEDAKTSSNLNLDYLNDAAEIERNVLISDDVMIDGLQALVDDGNYQGPRRLFLCSFMCQLIKNISNVATIEPHIIKAAYKATLKDFKSTNDAIEALDSPKSLVLQSKQNRMVQTLLDSLMRIGFHSLMEKSKSDRFVILIVKGLLRKDFSSKIQHYRRVRFIASVQIRNALTCYFRCFLSKKSVQRRPLSPEERIRPFKRTPTKVYRNKAKRIEEFKTRYIVKLCLSNIFKDMSRQYRQSIATRRHHYTALCQVMLSDIMTESQFAELVSCVIQDALSKYLYRQISVIRNYTDDTLSQQQTWRSDLGKLQIFYKEKAPRGTEVVERVCYTPDPTLRPDSVLSVDSATNDFCCQVILDHVFDSESSTISIPVQQLEKSPPKEYVTSTTQIRAGDFDPTPPTSLTSILTQTDLIPAPSSDEHRFRKSINKKRSLRPYVARSRSFDSAIGDDSIVSADTFSSRLSTGSKDVHIPKSPFNINVRTPFNPSTVLATGPGLLTGVVGKVSLFEIDCRAAGNAPLNINVEDDNHNLVKVKVVETQPGCYDVSFIPETAIPHFVNVLWNDFNIKGSPFKVTVLPRPEKDINLGGEGKIRVYYSTTTSSEKIRHSCRFLQSLLERKKVHLREDFEPWIPIDIGMDREERNRIFEKANIRKTPMLFIDDQYVGDYDDVIELDEIGELDRLLSYCSLKYRNLHTIDEARKADELNRMQASQET